MSTNVKNGNYFAFFLSGQRLGDHHLAKIRYRILGFAHLLHVRVRSVAGARIGHRVSIVSMEIVL